jgi:eukaryotic-like serine/threonine-protein kinase
MIEHVGPYKILERLGSGVFGDVYRARDTRLGRTAAIRTVPDSIVLDADRRGQFRADAQRSAALSHPNIATLYEVGDDGGTLFLASEFVSGESLQAAIGGRPMHPRRALDLGSQIADALADAHAHGIVHGHLNPSTIVVTLKGNAKVMDVGLSRWMTGRAPHDQSLGARAYVAPEQSSRGRVDQRTDIFSLGVVLFEMLTGMLPVSEAAVPSSANSSLPVEIDAVVAKAMAKDPGERHESAALVAADLRAIAGTLESRRAVRERERI